MSLETRQQAENDYMLGMKYKDIANKYDVSINTVKSWKSRYKWQRGVRTKNAPAKKVAHTKKKKGAHKAKRVQVDKGALKKVAESDLPDKRKLFCMYYLKNHNATQSYLSAYGSSYATAMAEGYKLLRNPQIKEMLNELRKEQVKDLYLDSNDVAAEYAKQAFSSLGNFLDYDVQEFEDPKQLDAEGNPKRFYKTNVKPKDYDKIDWSLVKSFHLGKDGLVIELYDKQKALKELESILPEPQIEENHSDAFVEAILKAEQDNKKE